MPEKITYQEYENDCNALLHLFKLSILNDAEYETIWNKVTQYYISQKTNSSQMEKMMSLLT